MKRAVILAAGMATRLRPLTDHCPKCLLRVGNRSLLQRVVDALVDCGISDITLVTGYREEMIREAMTGWYPQLGLHFVHNKDYQTTNNIYSLWLARPWVDGKDFLLLDSDILMDPELIRTMLRTDGAALAVNRHELGEEEMKVVVDAKGEITEISKTCRPEEALGESVGVEKIDAPYSTRLFSELETMMLKEHLENVFYEQAFQRLIPQGYRFKVVDTTSLFSMELDTVDDFHSALDSIPASLR